MTADWKAASASFVLRHHDAAGQIATHLRHLISSGVWQPGERLPSEAELAAGFSVARGTVREALKNLSAAGMVRSVRGNTGGTFVSLPTVARLTETLSESIRMRQASGPITVSEIDEARLHLERSCVALAAARRTDEDLERMRECIDRSRDLSISKAERLELDTMFHSAVATAARNEILDIAMTAVHIARGFADSTLTEAAFEPEHRLHAIDQHMAILEAIENRDPASAIRAVEDHVKFMHSLRIEEPAEDA
ncbi:FadR/GntR family transcriptional regulator [Streptomyces sp. NPDC048504]|uniref:FadR/GntR family transcriptional regulator n=1 Tax=Streptomyces TaxID=1883 RepID=UPI0034181F4E